MNFAFRSFSPQTEGKGKTKSLNYSVTKQSWKNFWHQTLKFFPDWSWKPVFPLFPWLEKVFRFFPEFPDYPDWLETLQTFFRKKWDFLCNLCPTQNKRKTQILPEQYNHKCLPISDAFSETNVITGSVGNTLCSRVISETQGSNSGLRLTPMQLEAD